MTGETKHIIHRLNLDVDVPDLVTARRIHDHAIDFLYANVLPQIEGLFDKLDTSNVYLRGDELNINLDFDSEDEFNKKFANAAAGKLGSIVLEKIKPEEKKREEEFSRDDEVFLRRTEQEKRMEVFYFFLQTGRLPWYADVKDHWLDETILLELIQEEPIEWKKHFLSNIPENELSIHRIAKQFSVTFISRIIYLFFKVEVEVWLNEELKNKTVSNERTKNECLLYLLENIFLSSKKMGHSPGNNLPEETDRIEEHKWESLKKIIKEAIITEHSAKEILFHNHKEKEKEEEIDDTGALYVQHAGLILLHPYLLYFFKEFDLMEGEYFVNEDSRQTAVHLLHYLATGNEQPFEYDMLMEKHLCGWSQDKALEKFIELSPAMKNESEKMLKAVIHHWKILKTTSVQSIQETFLCRNGKLILSESRHRLIVESCSIDILLEYLPWNFSIISLPWMDRILYVDWIINN